MLRLLTGILQFTIKPTLWLGMVSDQQERGRENILQKNMSQKVTDRIFFVRK